MEAVFIPEGYFRELCREEIFPDSARPLEVELGCGEGSFLVEMARQHPERDFLALERMLGRVEKTARKIACAGLRNARVLRIESSYACAWLLPAASVARLHLLCPDPWPKKKHHKYRLVNCEEFLAGVERILAPEGEFLLKTDHEPYFEDALLSLGTRGRLERMDWPEEAFFYPRTDFENQWLAAGKTIHRARWRRAARAASV